MPLDKFGVPERKIEPNLFKDKGEKTTQAVQKISIIANQAALKADKTQTAIKVEKDDGSLARQLQWAELVADESILKTDDRAKFKEHLDKLLAGLNLRYIKNTSGAFPTNGELSKLTKVVFALGKLVGVKKTDFGDLLGAVNRIQNRWSKVALLDFADALRERLLRIPTSPAAVVDQAANNNAQHKETLEAIKSFLVSGLKGEETKPWERWYEAIRQHQFPTSSLMKTGAENLLQLTSGQTRSKLAYLLFMDLRRQQLEWNAAYGRKITPSLQWIYQLQRPEDYTQLRQKFYGTALSPVENAQVSGHLGNRIRQKRHYKKTTGKQKRSVKK